MSEGLRIGILGAAGRMGRTVVEALDAAEDLEIVAALGRDDAREELVQSRAQIVVDVTTREASEQHVYFALAHGMHVVVGTSGWDNFMVERLRKRLVDSSSGVLIAPNFALGSVLATRFAAQAARYFPSVEIVELHHPEKVDAPSGTARRTAQLMAVERRHMPPAPDATQADDAGARGMRIHDIPIHAVRLTGLTAHQEVHFGAPGEQLTIRHDSFGYDSYKPGILLAVREVRHNPGLSHGLECYLNLEKGAKS